MPEPAKKDLSRLTIVTTTRELDSKRYLPKQFIRGIRTRQRGQDRWAKAFGLRKVHYAEVFRVRMKPGVQMRYSTHQESFWPINITHIPCGTDPMRHG